MMVRYNGGGQYEQDEVEWLDNDLVHVDEDPVVIKEDDRESHVLQKTLYDFFEPIW